MRQKIWGRMLADSVSPSGTRFFKISPCWGRKQWEQQNEVLVWVFRKSPGPVPCHPFSIIRLPSNGGREPQLTEGTCLLLSESPGCTGSQQSLSCHGMYTQEARWLQEGTGRRTQDSSEFPVVLESCLPVVPTCNLRWTQEPAEGHGGRNWEGPISGTRLCGVHLKARDDPIQNQSRLTVSNSKTIHLHQKE